MKIALSLLCEHPHRLTGLTSVFREMVGRSLSMYPNVEWIVFTGGDLTLCEDSERVRHVHDFPGNDRLHQRLLADHLLVSPAARKMGARALVTVGFVPLRNALPTAMHLLTLHHLDTSNRTSLLRRTYRKWSAERGLRLADLVITNSEFAATQIASATSSPIRRLVISNEGLDHEVFHPVVAPGEIEEMKAELDLDPGYLLWISNLYPYKQASRLVAAYSRLPAALRSRHPLVFIGGDWDGQRAATAEQAARLGIASDIRFLGWIPERWIAPVYRHARAHVLSSREETWGRTVTEAMACGCPCLVNDIPVMHEVTAGAASILDFADTAAASLALETILTDEPFREKLRAAGLARAASLSFDRLTRERMDAILELTEPRSQNG